MLIYVVDTDIFLYKVTPASIIRIDLFREKET